MPPDATQLGFVSITASFVGWCSLGALVALLISGRRRIQALIGLGVATAGTALTVFPQTRAYWWSIIIIGALLIALVKRARDRFRLVATVAYQILTNDVGEWESSRRENVRLKRILRSLALEHKQSYKFSRYELTAEIEEGGTSRATRIYDVIPFGSGSVSWIGIGLGATGTGSAGATEVLEVTEQPSGRSLEHEVYEEGGSVKRMLVFFREAIPLGSTKRVAVVLRIEKCWAQLFDQGMEDDGTVVLETVTDELSLTLKLPPSIRVAGLDVTPNPGEVVAPQGATEAVWTARGPALGRYRYVLRVYRTREGRKLPT